MSVMCDCMSIGGPDRYCAVCHGLGIVTPGADKSYFFDGRERKFGSHWSEFMVRKLSNAQIEAVEAAAAKPTNSVLPLPDDMTQAEFDVALKLASGRAHQTASINDIKIHIADEAKRIVYGARRNAYGKPEDNFERIARFWQAYFENTGRGDVKITARDVSPLMRLMKEARLCETPDHYDSFVDLVGYSLTGAEVNGVKSGS